MLVTTRIVYPQRFSLALPSVYVYTSRGQAKHAIREQLESFTLLAPFQRHEFLLSCSTAHFRPLRQSTPPDKDPVLAQAALTDIMLVFRAINLLWPVIYLLSFCLISQLCIMGQAACNVHSRDGILISGGLLPPTHACLEPPGKDHRKICTSETRALLNGGGTKRRKREPDCCYHSS